MSKYLPTQIFNSDQSGFSYEVEPKRTLSEKGEKSTMGLVKSMNKVTHSYSIMPIINMNGNLLSPMLIGLQEAADSFGPRASSKIEELSREYPNVFITCSKSGKLDKAKMKMWVEYCLQPNIKHKCLLLLGQVRKTSNFTHL